MSDTPNFLTVFSVLASRLAVVHLVRLVTASLPAVVASLATMVMAQSGLQQSLDGDFGLAFGRAVCVMPTEAGVGRGAFVVSAPGTFGGEEGGALYFFEGTPPQLVRSFRGRSGHGLARDIAVVQVEGSAALYLESDHVGPKAFHLYSMDGEWMYTFAEQMGRPVPVGDVNGDGSTNYCVQSGEGTLALVDWRGKPLPDVSPEKIHGTLLTGINGLDGRHAQDLLLVLGGETLQFGVAALDASRLYAVLDWASRPYARTRLDEVRSVRIRGVECDARHLVAIADSGWDWPWGRVAVWSVSADGGELVYAIEDTYSTTLSSRRIGSMLGFAMCVSPDIDGDGWEDLIVSAPDSRFGGPKIHAFSGATGKRLWVHAPSFYPRWMGASMALYIDYDGDGVVDILVGGADLVIAGDRHDDGGLKIISGKTGTVLWEKSIRR